MSRKCLPMFYLGVVCGVVITLLIPLAWMQSS